MIETLTASATYNCTCGVTWYASLGGCCTPLPNSDSLLWAPVRGDGGYTCRCGEAFRIFEVGQPVAPHPRQHPERGTA